MNCEHLLRASEGLAHMVGCVRLGKEVCIVSASAMYDFSSEVKGNAFGTPAVSWECVSFNCHGIQHTVQGAVAPYFADLC